MNLKSDNYIEIKTLKQNNALPLKSKENCYIQYKKSVMPIYLSFKSVYVRKFATKNKILLCNPEIKNTNISIKL